MALGIGGAAAQGIEAGFNIGQRFDEAQERKRATGVAEARTAKLDSQRESELARNNAQEDEDRGMKALDDERNEHAYFGAGLAAQYGGVDKIPETEGKAYAAKASDISTRRAKLLRARYAPVVEKEQQWAKDTASRLQTGQIDINSLGDADFVRLIQGTGLRPVSDYLAPQGGKSAVRQNIDDVTAGIQTQNDGLVTQGANGLLGPEIQTGLGHVAPDGSEIVKKELAALVPAPGMGQPQAPAQPQGNPVQGLAAALTAASAPDSPAPAAAGGEPTPGGLQAGDGTTVMPVLRVTARHPDGTEVSYHAPITKGRGTGPDDEVAPGFKISDAMDRMGKLGVLETLANTPAGRAKIERGLKELGPQANSFLSAYYAMHGDAKALLPPGSEDPLSKKITAIQKFAVANGIPFEEARKQIEGKEPKAPTGVAGTLAAIKTSGLSPEDQKKAERVALKVDAAPKAPGKTSASGSGALGGAPAPDPKSQAAVDFWAKAVIAGDKDWQVGLARSKSGSTLIEAVKRRVPEMAAELGLTPQDIGTARAQSAALTSTLKDLTKRSEAVDLFASKVEKDMQTFDKLLDNASTGSPLLLSKPINALRRQFSDADLAQLDLAAKQVGAEYERLITGGTLSVAQLHAGASEDAKKLINGDMPPAQARAVMKTMRQEMANAKSAAHESTARVQNQLRGLGNGPLGGVPPPSAAPPAKGTGLSGDTSGTLTPPKPGAVMQGYRFKGGDPAVQTNWEKVQ